MSRAEGRRARRAARAQGGRRAGAAGTAGGAGDTVGAFVLHVANDGGAPIADELLARQMATAGHGSAASSFARITSIVSLFANHSVQFIRFVCSRVRFNVRQVLPVTLLPSFLPSLNQIHLFVPFFYAFVGTYLGEGREYDLGAVRSPSELAPAEEVRGDGEADLSSGSDGANTGQGRAFCRKIDEDLERVRDWEMEENALPPSAAVSSSSTRKRASRDDAGGSGGGGVKS